MNPPLSNTTVVIPLSKAFFAITVPKYADEVIRRKVGKTGKK